MLFKAKLKKKNSAYLLGSMTHLMRIQVTSDDFEKYTEFKILDSVAYPGTYKKFLMTRKEQEADWAISMTRKISKVQSAMRDLDQREQDLKMSQLSNLHIIWQHVAESNLPPSDLQLTIADCIVSNKKNIPCVIVKGKGRGAQPFNVNSKFAPFLYDLWIIYKMDILIKTFAKHHMETIDPNNQMSMADIVRAFQSKKEDIKHLAVAFYLAYVHVYKSAVCGLQTLI